MTFGGGRFRRAAKPARERHGSDFDIGASTVLNLSTVERSTMKRFEYGLTLFFALVLVAAILIVTQGPAATCKRACAASSDRAACVQMCVGE